MQKTKQTQQSLTSYDDLIIYYQKVRGLGTKTSMFYNNISAKNLDIVILTETWLREDILSSELFSECFNVFRRDRASGRGGGALIAVRDMFYSNRIDHVVIPVGSVDSVAVRIKKADSVLQVIGVYIPPNQGLAVYETVFDYLDSTLDFSLQTIIVGDFNIPLLYAGTSQDHNVSSTAALFSNFINFNSLTQHNEIKNINNRLLDLVLATERLECSVVREDYPLVPEDAHHPALRILWTNNKFDKVHKLYGKLNER